MKNVLKLLLSAVILFAAVPTVNATPTQACEMACAEEVKKKKKKGKKKISKGKKKKKGFFSKVFGSK
jgi:hypothetical protein